MFELDQWSRVFRKQLVELVQLTYGKSINRQLQEFMSWVVSESMLVYYLEIFRDSMWPGGNPTPPAPTRFDSEKARTRDDAKNRFLKSSPQALQTILGLSLRVWALPTPGTWLLEVMILYYCRVLEKRESSTKFFVS